MLQRIRAFFFFLRFVLCKYIVPVFRHSRRGSIIDGCEPLCGCWKLNSGTPEEQSVLLTSPENEIFFNHFPGFLYCSKDSEYGISSNRDCPVTHSFQQIFKDQ